MFMYNFIIISIIRKPAQNAYFTIIIEPVIVKKVLANNTSI